MAFLYAAQIFCIVMIFRNNKVRIERERCLHWAFEIKTDEEIRRRLGYYDMYTYNEMMHKFWKPVKSFYPFLHQEY